MFMNKVILCGTVCNKPELRETKNSVPVSNFVVKTIEKWTNRVTNEQKSNTKYHKVVVWGNIAKKAVTLLDRGKLVLLEGELSYHKNTHKNEKGEDVPVVNTEIKATRIQLYIPRPSYSDGVTEDEPIIEE